MRFDDQARFHPAGHTAGLSGTLAANGAQVFEHSLSTDVDERLGHAIVRTPGGDIRAGQVVLDTGFKKSGLTNGTVAAQILADLVRATHWAEVFEARRPRRADLSGSERWFAAGRAQPEERGEEKWSNAPTHRS